MFSSGYNLCSFYQAWTYVQATYIERDRQLHCSSSSVFYYVLSREKQDTSEI